MSTPLFDLSGKTAIVTGSSRGIGFAIAQQFAAHGARVVISSRKEAACVEAAARINANAPDSAIPIAANIGSKEALRELVERTQARLGAIDVLVCNAATNPYFGPMSGISDEQFRKVLDNNVLSSHWLISMVAPGMIARRQGSIILVSSMGGLRGSAVIGAYNISKAADFQLARNLALELGPHQIRVNCIAPGLIRTDFSRALWEDAANLQRALSATPLSRVGEPDEIAGAAVFLAADASRYVTGQTLVVDGGATITIPGL